MRHLCFIASICFLHCFPYQRQIELNRAAVLNAFPQASQKLMQAGRTMHYIRTGHGRPLVVFVHGSPGSWEAFAEFLRDEELTNLATLVSVDRLGFGESYPTTPELSLDNQEALIRQVIEIEGLRVKSPHVILVGHSFGGPIIARLAAGMRSPCTLVFVAAAVDPALEENTWYQSAGDWFWVRWLLPRDIDNANQEILPLKRELEKMLPLWPKIRARTIVLQGTADSLVPAANAEFIRNQLKDLEPEIQYLPGQGHFIPWEKPEAIKNVIINQLRRQP